MNVKKELLGQLLFVGFDGTRLDEKAECSLLKIQPGGIILFKRNISSVDQLSDLIQKLHRMYEPAPLIGIDQEGGRVNRLAQILPEIPDAAALGLYGDEIVVERLGILTGRALSVLGFDVDFAPVLDLSLPDSPNGIGNRSFGIDPERVIAMGAAFLRGLLGNGIAGTLKHFPGLGSSEIDSHDSLPVIDKKKLSLSMEDMKPFAVLCEIAPLTMVGHGYFPALSTERIPATLSSEIISDILRRDIGFEGVIITDDMEMGALKRYVGSGEEAVRAISAGCDMIMYASSPEMAGHALERIGSSLDAGVLKEKKINSSLDRIQDIKMNFVGRETIPGTDEVLKEISREIIEISAKITSR